MRARRLRRGGGRWNATTIEQYWRLWNIPVHKWLARHVYFPMMRAGSGRGLAILATFFFSALFHELLVGVPCHMLRLWAFSGIMLQGAPPPPPATRGGACAEAARRRVTQCRSSRSPTGRRST